MHPHLVSIFGIDITTYGLMVALAFMTLWLTTVTRGRALGYPPDFIQNLLTLIVLTAMVGARALYVFIYWDYFSEHPSEIVFSREGYVFVGGLIGSVAASAIFIKWNNRSALGVADLFAPYVPLAHAIGRFGCFLYGCCYGGLCSMPWGVRFPEGSPIHQKLVAEGLIDATSAWSLPVHPTQLYEMLFNLLIFMGILALRRVQTFRGQLAMAYIMSYGVARFIVEVYRVDPRGEWAGMSTSQWISIVFLFGGVFGTLVLWKKNIPPESVSASETNRSDVEANKCS